MRKISIIAAKELKTYFLSPIAYVVILFFWFIASFFFYVILYQTQEASLRYVFGNMAVVILFIVPLITMRLLSEEVRSGTIETLTTDPVTDLDVVLGKYFGVFLFYITLLLPTGIYLAILSWLGNPDWGEVISGYTGLLCLGAFFLSAGILCSSLSKNQIVSGVICLVFLLILWVIGMAAEGHDSLWAKIVKYISVFDHFEDFTKGVLNTQHISYYLSSTILFLFLTVRNLETRRWK
jgi:ABC-2 type transport system permease protein